MGIFSLLRPSCHPYLHAMVQLAVWEVYMRQVFEKKLSTSIWRQISRFQFCKRLTLGPGESMANVRLAGELAYALVQPWLLGRDQNLSLVLYSQGGIFMWLCSDFPACPPPLILVDTYRNFLAKFMHFILKVNCYLFST